MRGPSDRRKADINNLGGTGQGDCGPRLHSFARNGALLHRNATSHAAYDFLESGGREGVFSEETASSSSATLSLQLPFSEDDTALLNGLGQTFQIASADGIGIVDSGGGIGGAEFTGPRTGLLEGLPHEAIRVRMLELKEELTHLDRCRTALEEDLRQERARSEVKSGISVSFNSWKGTL